MVVTVSRTLNNLLCHLLLVALLLWWPGQAAAAPEPHLTARSAILLDPRNGQVLLEKNPDTRMHPASTTKMMTAMLALERGQLDDMVTVSPQAAQVEGAGVELKPGEQMALLDLLYALLLPSANDAAMAIAEHIGGSTEGFVALMNAKARQIGANNTHFANPHGLTHPDHYSTARDLALIALHATANPVLREIVATPSHHVPRPGANPTGDQPVPENWETTNQLLWSNTPHALAGTTGIKTGYTTPAGRCLVFSVQREERKLLGVLLNSPGFEVYQDARVLAEHGFNNFTPAELARAGTEIARATVQGGAQKEVGALANENLIYNLPRDHNTKPEQQIQWREKIKAPVEEGEHLGQALWYLDGQEVGRVDLVAATAVPKRFPYWVLAFVVLVAIALRRKKLKQPPARITK